MDSQTVFDAVTEASLAADPLAPAFHRYSWDPSTGAIVDTTVALPDLPLYRAPDTRFGILPTTLIQALTRLRQTPAGRILSDLMYDENYRAEFDAGVNTGWQDGLAAAFSKWRQDYVTCLTLMVKTSAELLGDPESAALVTTAVIYEWFIRPVTERIVGKVSLPALMNPKLKKLIERIDAGTAQMAEPGSDEPVQMEFRLVVRSIFTVVQFLSVCGMATDPVKAIEDDPNALFGILTAMNFDPNVFTDVPIAVDEWYDALTTKAALVCDLALSLNAHPAEQGATIGYWMGATIGNTIRAGVEELLRAQQPYF